MADEKIVKKAAAEVKKETTAEVKKAAATGNKDFKLWAALCYAIPILVPIIVLATEKKEDKKLQFHAWEGLILGVAWWVVSFVLSFVVIGLVCFPVGWLGLLYLAYKVYNGEETVIPTVTEMAKKQVK
ncbi:DUF4870 domain-containing protein [Candidatus Micrarchaeota archaeon]|nr:DUF4870 domain-containing protein [Candidatus Micrarchaeota archaeon]MBU1681882.1 DUF4870 domain-containing protein [Candidatus Micrarchaeota archaeon]